MLDFKSTFENLLHAWQLRLQNAESQEPDPAARLQTCIDICKDNLLQLNKWVIEHSFPDKVCEIYFFKQVKPVVMARYIYYKKVLGLHTAFFNGCGLLQKERLNQKLQNIARYFDDNEGLYRYYSKGCTHYDEVYFVRGKNDWKIYPEVNHFDMIFSTSCDGKLAELMANEQLLKYIDGLLSPSVKLTESASITTSRPAAADTLQCTASLTDIVELGYAMHAIGFFNNGNASIKDVMTFLSATLKIDLRNFYHNFLRLRERKSNTKFLDELKAALLRHIESMDD